MKATKIDEQEYRRLLAAVLPRVIHSGQENERCTAVLEELLAKPARTAEEKLFIELVTLLIEDFEEKHYALPAAGPLEILRHLMDANGLRQADLVDVFGSRSIVSEVLSGKRSLAKSHIEKLSRRFHVSPGLFFESSRRIA